MKNTLSKRQEQILNYIKNEFVNKGYPPTIREICKGTGLNSPSTVHGHINNLVKKGYLRKDHTKPRCIEIVGIHIDNNSRKNVVDIPIVGKVTAGQPILAHENIETTYPIPSCFIDHFSKYFMLKIKGESMINAGILDGDYVLVKQQNIANDGDIVVALIEDEATVKRFFKEKDSIRLQPENSTMEPIIINTVRVLGLVKGIFRKL
ncbi:transcriptional repressor LexA [Crassaminicella profunda]|uniref:transcriptional repressor LexA n=1 Tax=Crassaminicella profunda TaxID=1286698 RepID=UPI001CA71474|nr:transcriptional repressor LexA [Crassaminicella profunda]QZY56733.1 transcriptional repressor LexA [Crassaminicella profunda]